MLRRPLALLAATVVATASLGACASSEGDTPGPTTTANTTTTETTETTVGAEASALEQLRVATPDPNLADYRRDAFGGGSWDYDPTTGCNIRELVLIEESLVPPDVDEKCRSTNGRWRSLYDGVTVDDVADLQIDHFIPLANAWRAGAATWTPDQRAAFANDLSDPATLIAVTGSTNQSKSDSTPDEWLPPDPASWCTYARSWVQVKSRWNLSVTPAEKATLAETLAGCAPG